MKRFTTIALVALLALAALVVPATAAESIEVRSQVYNGSEFSEIIAGGDVVINATNFAGFWYDLDDGLSSETLTIVNNSALVDGTTIQEDGLVYNASIQQTDYEAAFGDDTQYPIMGLFAEEYVPLADDSPDQLVKLLLDNDDKYTLRTGSSLELAGGYELTAKQIDVEGDKVWMELSKDGEFIEDEVVDVSNTSVDGETWSYDVDVADEDDVVVFKVFITDVFQGQVDSLAVIEGLWLVDYENVLEIESADEFGELEVDNIGSTFITMNNTGSLSLTNDKTVEIAEGMSFKTADDDDGYLRFFLMKEYTEPGTYEIRGTVEGDGPASWDYSSFAGFFYDLDDNQGTESLEIFTSDLADGQRTIAEDELVYNTSIVQVDYEGAFDDDTQYPVMGLFAEKYVPVADDAPDQLVKLLLDNDDKYTLRTGSALELANGYELTAKQIDVEGDKVWMELSKDGEFIEDEVVDVSNTSVDGETWSYDVDVADEDDVVVFKVFITDVFQGQVDSLAVVEGIWLVDYENVLEIESADEFGELEVDNIGSTFITMNNTGSMTLGPDDTVDIAEGMKFKVANDDDNLRYYPFVEVTIGDGVVVDDSEAGPSDEVMPEEEEEAPVEEEVGEEVPEEETEMPEEEPEEEVEEETAEEESPGFEAVFAVAGLLAVAYLVRRN
ncbi:S-layer protein domain-containing protein [Methanolobus sp. WCC4]|uniref:S-layer protein domain-containing protein n=1 Tax=Methanolobus sp. WCC4 TaxID=3125784 RepID=UPI0030F68C6B